MGDIVKVSWSGGKDSTCAMLKHLERGDFVKAVCYIPMFTETIPLLCKDHYDFIITTAERFRQMGAAVYIVTGATYYDRVLHQALRGKFKGRILGFPLFNRGQCHFKRDSKLKALQKVDVGYFDYEDIGIAIDETDRHNQLNGTKRSILCELNITEEQAKQISFDHGMLSPNYSTQHRDGCTLCPFAKQPERERWFSDYPEAFPMVLHLQDAVSKECPERTPLRDYRWFIETAKGVPLSRSQWLDNLLE